MFCKFFLQEKTDGKSFEIRAKNVLNTCIRIGKRAELR